MVKLVKDGKSASTCRELEVLRTCCKGDSRSANLHPYHHGGADNQDGNRSIVLGWLETMTSRSCWGPDKPTTRRSAVAVRTTIRVLMGLSDLHQQGFVHCDLGFENVMVTGADPETAMLIDFGRCATANCKRGMAEHSGGV